MLLPALAVLATAVSPTAAAEFGPDHDATRAMIATFLWRLEGAPSQGDSTHDFIDVTRGWQLDPVEWLWRNELTTGRSPTMFAPDQPVTRGELLTFVWRRQGEPAPPADLAAPDPIDCLVAGRRVTAHVHDHRTGCTYELNPGLSVTTASVIKAQVLAGVMLPAQDRGTSGDLSPADEDRARLMMHFSHNRPPTSALYVAVGGAAGMDTIDAHSVATAWDWMNSVSVGQSPGISAGLPAGHDVALKNGFYPMTVMTEGTSTEAAGIALVELVTAHVNDRLTVGDAAAIHNGGEAAPLSGQRVCAPLVGAS